MAKAKINDTTNLVVITDFDLAIITQQQSKHQPVNEIALTRDELVRILNLVDDEAKRQL